MSLDSPEWKDTKDKKKKREKFTYWEKNCNWNRPPNNMMISKIPLELLLRISSYTLLQLWKVKKILNSEEWKNIPEEILLKLHNEIVKREVFLNIKWWTHRNHLYEVYDKEKK